MQISLVRPSSLLTAGQISLSITPPLGLAYIASSLIGAGHQVQAVDAVGENVTQFKPHKGAFILHGLGPEETVERIDRGAELIGVSTMFSHEWPHIREMIRLIRRRHPHSTIIVGGEHATALAEFVLETTPEVDACALGEGEESILAFTEALSASGPLHGIKGIATRTGGKIVNNGLRPRSKQVDAIPRPAWELFPVKNYLDHGLCSGTFRGRSMPITFTRGCPYECTFCSNPGMWTQRWISRSPARVVEEMEWLIGRYGIENFECCDLTAIVRKDWTVEFSRLLIQRGLNIAWQFPSGTRSEAIDAEVCGLLHKSGCRNLVYAPESGSPAVLKRIKKRVNLDNMKKSIKSARDAGINVRVNLVLGFPGDTHRNILETFGFIFDLAWIGVHDMTHFIFTAYPGSELFNQLRTAGKIPRLDEEYFLGLLSMTDLKKTVSHADGITARQLSFYRVASLVWFYSLMFLFRPWRILTILRNVFRYRQESRMEMAVKNLIFRRRSATSTVRS